jgi:hypothetical protein
VVEKPKVLNLNGMEKKKLFCDTHVTDSSDEGQNGESQKERLDFFLLSSLALASLRGVSKLSNVILKSHGFSQND